MAGTCEQQNPPDPTPPAPTTHLSTTVVVDTAMGAANGIDMPVDGRPPQFGCEVRSWRRKATTGWSWGCSSPGHWSRCYHRVVAATWRTAAHHHTARQTAPGHLQVTSRARCHRWGYRPPGSWRLAEVATGRVDGRPHLGRRQGITCVGLCR